MSISSLLIPNHLNLHCDNIECATINGVVPSSGNVSVPTLDQVLTAGDTSTHSINVGSAVLTGDLSITNTEGDAKISSVDGAVFIQSSNNGTINFSKVDNTEPVVSVNVDTKTTTITGELEINGTMICSGGMTENLNMGNNQIISVAEVSGGTSGLTITGDNISLNGSTKIDNRITAGADGYWSQITYGSEFISGTQEEARLYIGASTDQPYSAKSIILGGDLNMANNKITSLSSPDTEWEAVNKEYCDGKLPLSGGTMTGTITMASAYNPSGNQDVATKAYVDNQDASASILNYMPRWVNFDAKLLNSQTDLATINNQWCRLPNSITNHYKIEVYAYFPNDANTATGTSTFTLYVNGDKADEQTITYTNTFPSVHLASTFYWAETDSFSSGVVMTGDNNTDMFEVDVIVSPIIAYTS